MKRKFIVAVALTLSLLAFITYADDSKHAEHLQQLVSELQLDDSQTAQFTAIMEAHHEARKANRSANRETRREMRDALFVELSSVLTDEQLNTFREMSRKHHQHKKEKHSRNTHCAPVAGKQLSS